MSKILEVLNRKSVELKSEVIQLGLQQEIDADLDKLHAKRRALKSKLKSIASQLGDLNPQYNGIFSKAKNAENMAKELGVEDVRKFFGNRGDEAKEFGQEALKISIAIDKLTN